MKKIIESLKEKLTYYDLNKYIKPLIVIGIGVFFVVNKWPQDLKNAFPGTPTGSAWACWGIFLIFLLFFNDHIGDDVNKLRR